MFGDWISSAGDGKEAGVGQGGAEPLILFIFTVIIGVTHLSFFDALKNNRFLLPFRYNF